jgi:hypothetical protein
VTRVFFIFEKKVKKKEKDEYGLVLISKKSGVYTQLITNPLEFITHARSFRGCLKYCYILLVDSIV